ncbi:MAG TPA: hypothetical protein VGD15_05045, partial [Kribbella sp.]
LTLVLRLLPRVLLLAGVLRRLALLVRRLLWLALVRRLLGRSLRRRTLWRPTLRRLPLVGRLTVARRRLLRLAIAGLPAVRRLGRLAWLPGAVRRLLVAHACVSPVDPS